MVNSCTFESGSITSIFDRTFDFKYLAMAYEESPLKKKEKENSAYEVLFIVQYLCHVLACMQHRMLIIFLFYHSSASIVLRIFFFLTFLGFGG